MEGIGSIDVTSLSLGGRRDGPAEGCLVQRRDRLCGRKRVWVSLVAVVLVGSMRFWGRKVGLSCCGAWAQSAVYRLCMSERAERGDSGGGGGDGGDDDDDDDDDSGMSLWHRSVGVRCRHIRSGRCVMLRDGPVWFWPVASRDDEGRNTNREPEAESAQARARAGTFRGVKKKKNKDGEAWRLSKRLLDSSSSCLERLQWLSAL